MSTLHKGLIDLTHAASEVCNCLQSFAGRPMWTPGQAYPGAVTAPELLAEEFTAESLRPVRDKIRFLQGNDPVHQQPHGIRNL